MPPDGPRVLITGAGSGIGRALAVEAARQGAEVLLVGRRAAALEATLALLGKGPHRCLAKDVTLGPDRRAIAAAAGARLDLLFNNAGLVASGLLEETGDRLLEEMVATNLTAPLALSRELLPPLRAAGGGILFVGSVFGEIGHPYFAAYSATKHALRGAADALRRELAAEGIAVTYAAPRATMTPATERQGSLVRWLSMRLDQPEVVARRLWRAAVRRRASLPPPTPERFFVALQRLAPGVVDLGLKSVRRKVERARAEEAARSLHSEADSKP